MKTTEIFALCIVMIVVSFLGFVVENVWLAATKGFIDNRNMCLPFLLGYGLAIAIIYIMFGTPANLMLLGKKIVLKNTYTKILIYFGIVFLCVCLGEIALGTIVEKTYHIIWWDYTRLPFHITRYTSIPTSMAFATMICIFMRRIFDPLMEWALTLDYETLRFTAISGMILLVVDFIHNAVRIYLEGELKPLWKIDTTNTKAYQLLHS